MSSHNLIEQHPTDQDVLLYIVPQYQCQEDISLDPYFNSQLDHQESLNILFISINRHQLQKHLVHIITTLEKSASYLDSDWSKYDLDLYERYRGIIPKAQQIASRLSTKVDIGVKKPHSEANGQPALYVSSQDTRAADEVASEIEIQLNMNLKKLLTTRDLGSFTVCISETTEFRTRELKSYCG